LKFNLLERNIEKDNNVNIEPEIRAIHVNNVHIYCNAVGTFIEGMVTNMAQHAGE
jgi:hypothetical protein